MLHEWHHILPLIFPIRPRGPSIKSCACVQAKFEACVCVCVQATCQTCLRVCVLAGEMPDVEAERERVAGLSGMDMSEYPIVVQGVRKVFPGQDGGQPKVRL